MGPSARARVAVGRAERAALRLSEAPHLPRAARRFGVARAQQRGLYWNRTSYWSRSLYWTNLYPTRSLYRLPIEPGGLPRAQRVERAVLGAPQLATPCLLGLPRLALGGAPHSEGAAMLLEAQQEAEARATASCNV